MWLSVLPVEGIRWAQIVSEEPIATTIGKAVFIKQKLFESHALYRGFGHNCCEITFVLTKFPIKIVDPDPIAATGLPSENSMVFESVFIKPLRCDKKKIVSTSGEKYDAMPSLVQPIDDFDRTGEWQACYHSFRLFIGNVVCDRAVNVY
jgi:hypothetical protein